MLDYRLMSSKHRNPRWIRRGLWIGVLAVGAACSGQSGSAPSSVPAEPTTVSSPVTTTTEVEWRTVPAPLTEEDEEEVRVRFVAYGDVDPNDDIPFGVIPDVRIAVIPTRSAEWWNTVGSNLVDVGPGTQNYIPPGAQIQSTPEDIAASPIDFLTTRLDGTTETYIKPSADFSVCVIPPVGTLIAGCSTTISIWRVRNQNPIFYVHFSHGRAYIENGQDGSERYHRYLYGDLDSYDSSGKPATVTLVSTGYTGTDVPPFIDFLAPDASLAVIDDSEIGAWWTAVFDGATAVTDGERYPLFILSGWEYGWGIPFDMDVRERVLQSVPVRIIDIGWPGIIEMDMAPGNYLLCHVTYEFIADCNYDSIVAAQDYIYRVTDTDIWQLSDIEGRQLLEEVKDWRIRARRVGN